MGPNGQVVAVDPDSQRIEFAKKENARPNIEYVVGDDQSFPGKDSIQLNWNKWFLLNVVLHVNFILIGHMIVT